MTTVYEDIVRVMSDGEPRSPREIVEIAYPELRLTHEKTKKASSVGSIISRKARIWGEFECVGETHDGHKHAKIWRMIE